MKINALDKMVMGWMAIAVLLISTSIALKAYVDFGGSICALMFTFLICSAVQLMGLGSMYLVIDALCSTQKKSAAMPLPQTIPKEESAKEPVPKELEPVAAEETTEEAETPYMGEEDYEERNREHRCNYIDFSGIYYISVFASADGYENSDVAKATVFMIDDDSNTAVEHMSISKRKCLISKTPTGIIVEGLEDGEVVKLYNIAGMQLASGIAQNNIATIPCKYGFTSLVLKIGTQTLKLSYLSK